MTPPTDALGTTAADTLVEARLVLHHAAQLAAAVGRCYSPPDPGDEHANLGWSADLEAFVGHTVRGDRAVAAALRPADLTLALVDDRGTPLAEQPLDGQTIARATDWLRLQLELVGLEPRALHLQVPYFLPEHDVLGGRPFELDAPAQAELAQWFGLAAAVLEPVARARPEASAVRCWPHHFDIATLLTLQAGDDPESARTVGVGLSPGDDSYDRPYLYVTPWPAPEEPAALPDLPDGGRWNDDGWVGAVLQAEAMAAGGDPVARLARYLDAVVPLAIRVASATPA